MLNIFILKADAWVGVGEDALRDGSLLLLSNPAHDSIRFAIKSKQNSWRPIDIGYKDAEKLIIELQAMLEAKRQYKQASAPPLWDDVLGSAKFTD